MCGGGDGDGDLLRTSGVCTGERSKFPKRKHNAAADDTYTRVRDRGDRCWCPLPVVRPSFSPACETVSGAYNPARFIARRPPKNLRRRYPFSPTEIFHLFAVETRTRENVVVLAPGGKRRRRRQSCDVRAERVESLFVAFLRASRTPKYFDTPPR